MDRVKIVINYYFANLTNPFHNISSNLSGEDYIYPITEHQAQEFSSYSQYFSALLQVCHLAI